MANDPYRAPPAPDSDWHASLAAMHGIEYVPPAEAESASSETPDIVDNPQQFAPPPVIGDYMGISFDSRHPDAPQQSFEAEASARRTQRIAVNVLAVLCAGIGIALFVIAVGAFNAPNDSIADVGVAQERYKAATDTPDDYFWQSSPGDYGIYGAEESRPAAQERQLSPALSNVPDRRVISLEEETHDALLDALLNEQSSVSE